MRSMDVTTRATRCALRSARAAARTKTSRATTARTSRPRPRIVIRGAPFEASLNSKCIALLSYKCISVMYMYITLRIQYHSSRGVLC